MSAGGSGGSRRGWIAWVVATGCAVGGVAAFVGARNEASASSTAHAAAESVEIVQQRALLRRVHLDEVNAMMLDLIGVDDDATVAAARAARLGARATARGVFERIAAGNGTNAVEAAALLGTMRDDDAGDADADPLDLFHAARAFAWDGRPLDGLLPIEVVQLDDLRHLDAVGAQILNDGLDAEYVLRGPDATDPMRDYVGESADYLAEEGGYLGRDRADPITDSYVWSPEVEPLQPIVNQVDAIIAAGRLWEYDQWIVSWQDGDPGPSPLSIDELVDEAARIDTASRSLIDPLVLDTIESHRAEASAAHRSGDWLLALAWVLVAVASTIVLASAARRLSTMRRRSEMALVDHLTGAGNRHLLEERTAALLADPEFGHHLVAVVDMDRFKLINDTWGHAAGDAALVEVATRMQALVETLRAGTAGSEGTVVRLGGDEFLLSFHSRRPVDRAAVESLLAEIRSSEIVVADGERVGLSFSIGTAVGEGSCSLDDLMVEADLASYEDKAARGQLGDDRGGPHRTPIAEPSDIASM